MRKIKKTVKKWMGIMTRIVGVMSLVVMAGCSATTSSTYYNPAWTYDGKILAVRQTTQSNSTLFSGGGDPGSTSLVIMNKDGSDEREIRKFGVGKFFQASASPSGNYVALIWGAVVDIYTYPGFQFIRTLDTRDTQSGGNNINEFDWAPGDQKMVIRDDFGAYVYNIDGTRLHTLTNLRVLSFWRYTTNIYGDKKEGATLDDYPYIELSENDEIVRKVFTSAYFPHEVFPGGEFYYTAYRKYRLSDFSLVEEYPTLSAKVSRDHTDNGAHRLVPRPINPVNPNEVIYSGNGTFYSGATYGGIVVINLDGSNERILRP